LKEQRKLAPRPLSTNINLETTIQLFASYVLTLRLCEIVFHAKAQRRKTKGAKLNVDVIEGL
jgi:hypothetical protein